MLVMSRKNQQYWFKVANIKRKWGRLNRKIFHLKLDVNMDIELQVNAQSWRSRYNF